MSKIQKAILLSVALGGTCQLGFASTPWCANITSPTIWTTAGSPYLVNCDVYVTSTLTINPGVQVKFDSAKRLLVGYGGAGSLQAIGSSGTLIDFTANTVSPLAGFWGGIQFYSGSTSSRISFATIHWAGSSSTASVYIENAPVGIPTIDNTTIRDGTYAAISVNQGKPSLTTVTLTTHQVGIRTVNKNSSADLASATITGNTAYAMSFDPRTTLGTVTSLTVSANNPDAIELPANGSPVDVTTTWKKISAQSGTLPYVVTGSYINVGSTSSPFPVLSIEAGSVIKFGLNTQLLIGYGNTGQLQAIGSSTSRIEFTSSRTTPAKGDWYGLIFAGGHASSAIKFANIRWAGAGGNGGVRVDWTPLTFDHVLFDQNAYAGVKTYNVVLAVQTCDFTGNDSGIQNTTPTGYSVTASLNWWNSTSGPSAGQTVSPGVAFEPWLMGAESYPHYFTTASQLDRTFNPAIGDFTKVSFATPVTGTWTVNFINSGSLVKRTFTGSGTSATVTWDGKDGTGNDQPNGTYSYTIDSTDGSAHAARQVKGFTVIDRTKAIAISPVTPTLSQVFFSPNASPGVQDTTTLSTIANFDQVSWTITVKSGSTPVRTATGTGAVISFTWDGKNTALQFVADGVYTLNLVVTVGTASLTAPVVSTTVDNMLPLASITTPASGAVLSNLKQAASTIFAIVGSVSDTNITNWQLTCSGCVFPGIATGTANASGTLGSWDTFGVANNSYSLVLEAWDKAGNYKSISIPVALANFNISQSVLEFNAGAGNSVTYTSVIPASLTQNVGNLTVTLVIKNESDATVRTLVNAVSRGAGTYPDVWDGKGPSPSSTIQRDGGYFYVATVTAGGYTMTWDPRTHTLGAQDAYGSSSGGFDPFNNQPLTISYSFGRPVRTYIGFSTGSYVWLPCPNSSTFCMIDGRYEDSGPHTYSWAGVDTTGQYRPDVRSLKIIGRQVTLPVNAVVLFGTAPSVSNVTVTPPIASPPAAGQTIGYTFSSYQSQAATVTVTLLNQASLTVLRTLSLGVQAPGPHTALWDGKADNGMWVAPGTYLVTVSVVDSLGNQRSGQILSTVQY